LPNFWGVWTTLYAESGLLVRLHIRVKVGKLAKTGSTLEPDRVTHEPLSRFASILGCMENFDAKSAPLVHLHIRAEVGENQVKTGSTLEPDGVTHEPLNRSASFLRCMHNFGCGIWSAGPRYHP
jgi:hypothetical protein